MILTWFTPGTKVYWVNIFNTIQIIEGGVQAKVLTWFTPGTFLSACVQYGSCVTGVKDELQSFFSVSPAQNHRRTWFSVPRAPSHRRTWFSVSRAQHVIYTPFFHTTPSGWATFPMCYCRFMIGHSLGHMGTCMEDHACESELPHKNGNGGIK